MTALPQDQYDDAILNLVNQERTRQGLGRVSLSERLDAAADLQSRQMAQQDFFSHNNPVTGSTLVSRALDQGYDYTRISENIAAGQNSPEAVVQAWLNSEGHRRNILDPNVTHLGVGYFELANDTGSTNYGRYWTQVFGAGGNAGTYAAETSTPASPPPAPPTTNNNPAPRNEPSTRNVIEGTSAGNLLTGNSRDNTINAAGGNDTLRGGGGNDRLNGEQGRDRLLGGADNDRLVGGENDDVLRGGSGRDTLIGVNPSASNAQVGRGERDVLVGDGGADNYVLGQNGKVFYDDRNSRTRGTGDYALIRGFRQNEGDRILLEGRAADYVLGQSSGNLPRGTAIYHENNSGPNELIGIVQNVTINSLGSDAFRFV